MDGLDTLWILDSKGVCLLQQIFTKEKNLVDKNIFSSFVSALLTFSNRMFDDHIEKISMGRVTIFCKVFQNGKFSIALAASHDINEKLLHSKINEIGEAFEIEFGKILTCDVIYEDQFITFIDTIDNIFGIKTIHVIPEHTKFIELLEQAELNNYSELETVNAILVFFEALPQYKRKFLLQTTFSTISIFMDSPNLTFEQIKRFENIFSVDN